MVISIEGVRGGGKSDFYTTMQPPVLVISVDPNTPAVIRKIFGDDPDPEELRLVQLPFPVRGFEEDEDAIIDEANESWNTMHQEISDIVNGRCKVMPNSVALDSGSELNELNILREFGRTTQIHPNQRRNRMGPINADFKGLFRALEQANVHVGVTHRVREHWETVTNSKAEVKDVVVPGVYDRIGHKEMGNICNTEVLMQFNPEREGKLSAKFGMKILRSTFRPALTNAEYWGKVKVGKEKEIVRAPSFAYLGVLTFPGTTLEDWQ